MKNLVRNSFALSCIFSIQRQNCKPKLAKKYLGQWGQNKTSLSMSMDSPSDESSEEDYGSTNVDCAICEIFI